MAEPQSDPAPMAGMKTARRPVFTLPIRDREPLHERAAHRWIAGRLARLLGGDDAGDYPSSAVVPASNPAAPRPYLLPSTTIVGSEQARRWQLRDAGDLFGGVVDQPFIATKAISHPLIDGARVIPVGWSERFTEITRDAVLEGLTAFDVDDARRAALRLLDGGPVRWKPVDATAGRGQVLIETGAEIERLLRDVDPRRLAAHGIGLERHLNDVSTLSVGQVSVAGHLISYHGTQCLVDDNQGESVYGGSTLQVVRGGFDALLALDLAASVRRAVEQSRVYDAAALALFDGLFASRRNYDVAQGAGPDGLARSGVLEQSWRVGGASAAELAALGALIDDPSRESVWASTIERFGDDAQAPDNATILFDGVDPDLGRMIKSVVLHDGPSRP